MPEARLDGEADEKEGVTSEEEAEKGKPRREQYR